MSLSGSDTITECLEETIDSLNISESKKMELMRGVTKLEAMANDEIPNKRYGFDYFKNEVDAVDELTEEETKKVARFYRFNSWIFNKNTEDF